MAENIFAEGMNAFDQGYDRVNQFRTDVAKRQAAPYVARGDFESAAGVYGKAGLPDEARSAVADQQVMQSRKEANDAKAKTDQAAQAAQRADNLLRVTDMIQAVPQGQRQQRLQELMPLIQQFVPPEAMSQFASLDESHLTDQALAPWRAALGKAKEDYTLNGVRYSGNTNKPVSGFAEFSPDKLVYAVGDGQQAGGVPPPPAPPSSNGPDVQTPGAEAAWKGAIQQESGGRPGILGPETKYGRAEGETQLLPQTAQSMAQKLGVPWRPELMTATTPEGEDYQLKLGRAYFEEGLQKYNGDVRKALMYYHGGPDERQWGPKTNNYATTILASLGHGGGAGQSSIQGGDGQDNITAPQIPGMHLVSSGQKVWRDLPDGRQENMITGKKEGQPTDEDTPMTPATVQLLAGKYLNNGSLPPMGMGKTGTRNRTLILNAATEQAKALGLDANDLVAGAVTGKAAAQALSKATTMRSQVEGSEQTVLKNGQAALQLASQAGGPTGVPVLNRWIQAGRKKVAGDPQVAALDLAITTLATEYAKVMTTSTGTGGQTSDSARNEATRLINTAMTPEQLHDVIAQMKTEMDNRSASLRDTEAGLRNIVRNGGQPGGPGSQPASSPTPTLPAPSAPPPGNRKPLGQIFGGG
jgi:hypothetical protein